MLQCSKTWLTIQPALIHILGWGCYKSAEHIKTLQCKISAKSSFAVCSHQRQANQYHIVTKVWVFPKVSRVVIAWKVLSAVCVGTVYLCRQGGCCSTVRGVRGYSRWWHRPAARSQSGRRSSASPPLGKRPFQSSARWSRRRRGSCMARTFQLRGRTHTADALYHVESHDRPFNSHFIEVKVSGFVCLRPRCACSGLTDTLGQPLAPLGGGWISVVAGEEAVAGQDVALVTDELHSRSNSVAGACEHLMTVLHIPGVGTCHHWCITERNEDGYLLALPPVMAAVEWGKQSFTLFLLWPSILY